MSRLIVQMREYATNKVAASHIFPQALRRRSLRWLGAEIGPGTRILPQTLIRSPKKLTIGSNSFLSYRITIEGEGDLSIGSHCHVATGVTFVTTTHELVESRGPSRAGPRVTAAIRVEDGSWIGANVTILPGVVIGGACVIGAGAIVAASCRSNGLYVGVPARRIRDLPPFGLEAPR